MSTHKNIFYIFIFFLSLGLMVSEFVSSQGLTDKVMDSNKEKPIEISSDRMRSEEGGEKIIFSGNVIGTWGDLTITSDILEIYNSKNANNQTDEIIAIGNVLITRDKKRAKGDRAVYLDKSQKIILTGTPHATAWENKNLIEGKEMIFLLDQDRFVVNHRVRMKLFSSKKTNPGEKNKQ